MDAMDGTAARESLESRASPVLWDHVAWMACPVSRALRDHLDCPAIRVRRERRATAAILDRLD